MDLTFTFKCDRQEDFLGDIKKKIYQAKKESKKKKEKVHFKINLQDLNKCKIVNPLSYDCISYFY